MKLPAAFHRIFRSKQESTELFLSLIVDVDCIQGACWELSDDRPETLAAVAHGVPSDSWNSRRESAALVVDALKERLGERGVSDVIFGLPTGYLAEGGEILASVRPHLKQISQSLALSPMGYVSVTSALVYKLKHDEGVPPSVILLGLAGDTITVSLYKVGNLVGTRGISAGEKTVSELEEAFRSFKDVEILPSRIFLYGTDSGKLEIIKSDLLKYPWQTKANFLHFPKIEVLPKDGIVTAVSFAGASEFAKAVGKDTEETDEEEDVRTDDAASPAESTDRNEQGGVENLQEEHEEKTSDDDDMEAPSDAVSPAEKEDATDEEQEGEDMDTEEPENEERQSGQSSLDANVVMVHPEQLGFTHFRPPDAQSQMAEEEEEPEEDEDSEEERQVSEERSPGNIFSRLPLAGVLRLLRLPSFRQIGPLKIVVVLAGAVLLLAGTAYGLYYALASSTVTLLMIPKSIDGQSDVTIDPTAATVDAQNSIIPGKKKEQTLTGQKTIPVTGKKKVGDPAKGSVTVYNKSLSSRSFKKGTILKAGEIQYTLDEDVSVASASESIGSITFGKAQAKLTAAGIGAAGNVGAGTEFVFKDTTATAAVARNDQPFTGGTSRDITVVSRADTDALVKAVTQELVAKAKSELSGSLSAKESFVDATITTQVTEKQFQEELDQEVAELHGSVTLAVSGIAYDENDFVSLFAESLAKLVPTGYSMVPDNIEVSVKNIQVQKTGKIKATAAAHAISIPVVDKLSLQTALAGKTIPQVEAHLHGLPGIGEAEFRFNFSPFQDRLPLNPRNIAVDIQLAQ